MFGCHNCGKKPPKNAVFEKTPCAKCRAAQDPNLMSYYSEDPASFQTPQVMHPAYEGDGVSDEIAIEDVKEKIFFALSRTLRILVDLKEKSPETYRVVEAKMRDPLLSYAELAKQLSCRKQNILYHLKKAVKLCPELSCAFLVDTRRTNGRRCFSHRSGM